jgi:hypothetical protein
VGLSPEADELRSLAELADAPLVAAVVRDLSQRLAQAPGSDTLDQALLELHRSVGETCA